MPGTLNETFDTAIVAAAAGASFVAIGESACWEQPQTTKVIERASVYRTMNVSPIEYDL